MYDDIVLGFEFEVEGKNRHIYDLIDNSTSLTGLTEHYIEDYHDTRYKTAQGLWRVEEDETITGAEFISPPENYYKARETCKTFFRTIENTPGIKTTNTCGLHVGMSVNGNLDSIDLTSIIPNINYRLLATLWPTRMLNKNAYCNNLKEMLKKTTISLASFEEITINNIFDAWMNNPYSFIKTKFYENVEYIEFRTPGGIDYHLKFDKLFTSIDHIADILLGHTKLSKKNQQKKMYSYINRFHKSFNPVCSLLSLTPKTLLESKLSMSKFNNLYNITISELLHNNNTASKNLNKQNYLYYFFNYMAVYEMVSKLKEISSYIDNNTVPISVPENIQQLDMIKTLKLWKVLPYNLIQTLLNKLNQRAYNYFIKYYINNAKNKKQYEWISNICQKIDKV